MRVLVTGGAGYIGSVITEELLNAGHEVTVLDNLSKGHRNAVCSGAYFVQGELLDRNVVRKTLQDRKIEAVIHMAAFSLVGESMQKPRDYYGNNVEASVALLNTMCDCGVNNLVFSSTAAVYGEPSKQPIEENDPAQPTNPYGETKLTFEKMLQWYSELYGFKYTSLRYFNAAGATELNGEVHVPETHLIPAVLQVAQGKKSSVDVFGDDYPTRDGTCVRDYIHVIDLARAHILALDAEHTKNSIFNLGCGGEGYSVKEVLDTARKITGHPIPSRITERRPGDPSVLIASSDRIQKELGWKPQFQDLNSIIDSAWKWMVAHPNGYA
ncbi:UDP-glucose 4-epimerase GalE [bacterium]|nr:UDP-glucose 4-epimerase GalE [bacterium]MCI0604729.1 UDP-glucose 4-epimerase GalE [bacterium]